MKREKEWGMVRKKEGRDDVKAESRSRTFCMAIHQFFSLARLSLSLAVGWRGRKFWQKKKRKKTWLHLGKPE